MIGDAICEIQIFICQKSGSNNKSLDENTIFKKFEIILSSSLLCLISHTKQFSNKNTIEISTPWDILGDFDTNLKNQNLFFRYS